MTSQTVSILHRWLFIKCAKSRMRFTSKTFKRRLSRKRSLKRKATRRLRLRSKQRGGSGIIPSTVSELHKYDDNLVVTDPLKVTDSKVGVVEV
jgi:hypothetical protein